MSRQNHKQARREAVEREVRKREDVLAVPIDKQVYVFKKHFTDEGGPRGFWPKEYRDHQEEFKFDEWQTRLQRAPAQWEPVELVPEEDPDFPTDQPVGDYDEFAGMMIFSERAAIALKHLLQPSGLLLALTCATGDYAGFRLDTAIDALDVMKTKASWWPKKDGASSIYTYAFHTERLGSAGIFRVPEHFEVLVSHEFVNIARASGFTGFRFCRVWPTAMASLWWYHNWC